MFSVRNRSVKMLWENGTLWGFLQVIGKAGFGILVVPLLASRLSPDKLGLWYTFAALGSFGIVSDFGLTILFSRIFAAHNSSGDRRGDTEFNNILNGISEESLYFTAFRCFLLAGCITFIFLGFGGLLFLWRGLKISSFEAGCWLLYSGAWSVSVVGNFWIAYGNGLNQIAIVSRAILYSTGLGIFATWLILAFDSTILAPVAGFGIVNLAARILLARNYRFGKIATKGSEVSVELIRRLVPIGWRQALVAFSGFLIYQGSTIVIGSGIGRSEAATFAMTLQLVLVSGTISLTFITSKIPTLVGLRVSGDIEKLRNGSISLIQRTLWTFVFSQTLILLAGGKVAEMLAIRTPLLEKGPLIILLTSQLLEVFHVSCAMIYGTSNTIRWVWVSVASGVVLVTSQNVAVGYAGVWGVVCSQFVVQLLLNNWWPPIFLARDQCVGLGRFLRLTIVGPFVIWTIFCMISIFEWNLIRQSVSRVIR